MQHTDTFPTEQDDPIGIINGYAAGGGRAYASKKSVSLREWAKVREGDLAFF